jgi:hypothetical protein
MSETMRDRCSIPGCTRHAHARGLCGPHYMWAQRHGTVKEHGKRTDPERCESLTRARFFRQTIPGEVHPIIGTRCLLWTGAPNKDGYGTFSLANPYRKVRANRMSWYLGHGSFPKECVLHKCDNRACVNVEHLFLGTVADNNMDMIRKGRCRRKVELDEVLQIRGLRANGVPLSVVGERFKITPKHVSKIGTGKAWSHVARR